MGREQLIVSYLDTFAYSRRPLRTYSDKLEASLEEELQKLENPYDEISYELYVHDVDAHWGLKQFYPLVLRESLFIASFSHFETLTTEFCKKLQELEQLSLDLNDLKDKGVTRAYAYMIKVARLKISEESWENIVILNQLRNLFVHNNGLLESDKGEHKNIRAKTKDWPTIRAPETGRLELLRGFNALAIGQFVGFFQDLRAKNT